MYVTGTNDAIQAFSQNIAISAYSPKLGLSIASSTRAISANGGFIGLDVFSSNKAISARGLLIGLEVSSPVRAISAFSNFVAGEFYSNNIAISAFGIVNGLKVESPQKAILANGSNIGLEVFSNNRAISANGLNIGGEFYSTNIPLSTAFGKNLLHGFVGINTNTPTSALEVFGNTVLNGNGRITGNFRIDNDLTIYGNLSTLGTISYLDTRVTVTSSMEITNAGTGPALTVIQLGEQPVAQFYDESGHTALYIEGTSSKPGWVGIGNSSPNVALSVTGSISATNSLYILGDTTFYGKVSANTSLFTPIISTQDIKAYGGNGILIKTTSDVKVANFGNDGNTTIYGTLSVSGMLSAGNSFLQSLSLPVSSSITNNIVLDFSQNSYVICPIYTTTTISFSSLAPGKTIKAILSSIVVTPQTLNPDSRFIFVGDGRPTTLAASKVGYLQVESFGTTISSVIINYFAQN